MAVLQQSYHRPTPELYSNSSSPSRESSIWNSDARLSRRIALISAGPVVDDELSLSRRSTATASDATSTRGTGMPHSDIVAEPSQRRDTSQGMQVSSRNKPFSAVASPTGPGLLCATAARPPRTRLGPLISGADSSQVALIITAVAASNCIGECSGVCRMLSVPPTPGPWEFRARRGPGEFRALAVALCSVESKYSTALGRVGASARGDCNELPRSTQEVSVDLIKRRRCTKR